MLPLLILLGSTAASADGPAAKDDPKAIVFFESKIRPVLVQQCYRCHSVEAGKAEGGLSLDSRQAIRAGGDRGPAVVPGDPKKSLILKALAHTDGDLKMPPRKERLANAILNDFTTWIRTGAADPRAGVLAPKGQPTVDLAAGRAFWAYRKPVVPAVPAVKNPGWAKRELDYFVLAKLEASRLAPSADAEPWVLLRRLHFDLVGLSPAPDVLEKFEHRVKAHGLDAALESEVDGLLASTHFGERWGRHWLDVARYAESSGKEANITFPYAWRYRDYVLDCFNHDVPFDRFLTEQIAGDLLPASNPAERARLLTATGYLALGPKNLDEGNPTQFAADLVDEQIDAVTRGITANSVACARCHDHKFDPYAMEDYYALAGVFASTKTYFGTFVTPSNRMGGDPLVLPREANLPVFHESVPAERVADWKKQIAALKKQQDDGMAAAKKAQETGGDPEKFFSLTKALSIFWTTGALEGQLEKVDETGHALPLAMGVTDDARMVDAPVLERGEIGRPGKRVPRGFPRIVSIPAAGAVPVNGSGRLEFARWLTHPDQPLTARVMTNRVWRHLFGTGLVRTVDNFGLSGERPSHPELLDHLTTRFTANGWSVKKLVREIVLSRAYRQSSAYREAAFRADPENRLLWRASKRRLDAEVIRDSMLAVAGELDAGRPAASLVGKVIGDRPVSLLGLDSRLPPDLDCTKHRSVYLPVLRDRLPDVLELFDFAEPSLVTGDRETTNVPVQALFLMNSPFVRARAVTLANRLSKEQTNAERIRAAFRLCFSRLPDADEADLARTFLAKADARDEKARQQVLVAYCHVLLAAAEFRNGD